MHWLDVRTILIAGLLTSAVCTIAMAHLWLHHRRQVPGLGLWLADFVLQSFGVFAVALRGWIPPTLSIVLGTPMILLGTVLLYEGLLRYLGKSAPLRPNVVMLVVALAAQLWFGIVQPSLLARNLILSAGLAFICCQCAWLALRGCGPGHRASMRFLGYVFTGFCAVSALRVAADVLRHPSDDLFALGAYDAIALLLYNGLFLAMAIGLLVMVTSRLQASLLAELQARTETESALRQSQEKYGLAFQHSPYAITMTRLRDGRIVEANGAFYRLTGFSKDEAVGATTVHLGLWADVEDRDRILRQVKSRGSVNGDEVSFKRKSGEVFRVKLSAGAIDVCGETMLLAIMDDVTEQRRLEEGLRAAQKMEAVGRLAGGVAHDFNNMLSVIISNTRFAIDALEPNHSVQEDLSEIRIAAERASVLTRQLLAFGRKQIIDPEVLDLNEVARGLHNLLVRLLGEDVRLVKELATTLPRVKADRGQIEQLIMNLVVNARDAMPKGGELRIQTAEVREGETSRVRLIVADTGIGMDAATRQRIFEPFFTTKSKGKGTGLGLSTVYGIVSQNGGTIEVDSEPGRGTTFTIHLPATTEEMPDSKASLPPARSSHELILLVEDENAVRKVTARILGDAGYRVLAAANGAEAMAVSQAHRGEIHLLLTDVIMPGMNGRELADALRQEHQALLVLYMSGYTDDAIAQHGALEPGMKFIGKPFQPKDLLNKVREVLDGG